jgi:hypothetical protein
MANKIILIMVLVLVLLMSACTTNPDNMTPEQKEVAMQKEMEINPPKEMTEEERVFERDIARIAEEAVESTESGAIGEATAAVTKQGEFETRVHRTSGGVKIIEKDGQKLLVIDESFKSDSGPELHVILSSAEDPKNSRELHQGDFLDLGKLKSTKGTQTYVIPKDGNYNSVTIYCQPFKVLFGLAKLF